MSKPILVVLALCCVLVPPGHAAAQDVDPAFRADVEKLLVATGAANLAAQMGTAISNQLIDGMKQQTTEMPERAAEIIKTTLADEFTTFAHAPDGMQAKIVAIYARHFTHDEIRSLLAFYESPLGKKAVAELPALMREGMAAGQEWSQANMPRIMGVLQEKLKAEGVIK